MKISKNELLKILDEVRQEICDRELAAFTYECYNGSRFSNNYEINESDDSIRFKFEITTQDPKLKTNYECKNR